MSAWHRRCSERSRASQEGPTCEAMGRKSEWELKFETHHLQNAAASIPFREIEKSLLQFKVQTSAFLSSFLNQSREEELSGWAKKSQALFCHLPGWVFSLPSPPTSGLRQTSSKPGDSTPSLAGLLSRQREGTALPLGPTRLPLFWQRFVLT